MGKQESTLTKEKLKSAAKEASERQEQEPKTEDDSTFVVNVGEGHGEGGESSAFNDYFSDSAAALLPNVEGLLFCATEDPPSSGSVSVEMTTTRPSTFEFGNPMVAEREKKEIEKSWSDKMLDDGGVVDNWLYSLGIDDHGEAEAMAKAEQERGGGGGDGGGGGGESQRGLLDDGGLAAQFDVLIGLEDESEWEQTGGEAGGSDRGNYAAVMGSYEADVREKE